MIVFTYFYFYFMHVGGGNFKGTMISFLGNFTPKHSKYIMHFTQYLIWIIRCIFFCYVFFSRLTK